MKDGQGRLVLFMEMAGKDGARRCLVEGFQKVDDPHGRRKEGKKCLCLWRREAG
jgi:hypothetical protein